MDIVESNLDVLWRAASGIRRAPRGDPLNPGDNYLRAHAFFSEVVGESVESVFNSGAGGRIELSFRSIYAKMLDAEQLSWKQYLMDRVERRGWNPEAFMHGLSCIPRSVPQGHRWHLFRLHLNGHCTCARVHKAGVVNVPD